MYVGSLFPLARCCATVTDQDGGEQGVAAEIEEVASSMDCGQVILIPEQG
jgi:hypothetical protein